VHFKLGALAVAVVFPAMLFADRVTLKNGDTITGAIRKKDGDKLTIKSEFLGEVTMPWAAVTAIQSNQPVVVALPDGKILSGAVSSEGKNIQVNTPGGVTTSPLAEVSAIRGEAEQKKYERLLSPGWRDLWAGYFDLGLALARGNARTSTLTSSFSAARVTRSDQTTLYYNQIYSTAKLGGNNLATAEAIRGGVSYDHDIRPRVFLNVLNYYEYDRFQDLDLRFAIGGGLGFHAIKHERTSLDVLGGVDFTRETFTNHLTRNAAEVYWGDDWTYKISGKTSLNQSYRMFNNLTRTGEYRINFDLGSATTLKKWLSWQLTASDRFLSDPAIGRQRNDLLVTTGLRLSFSR
jgi:putative salt-induced outer membrane protein YdiY